MSEQQAPADHFVTPTQIWATLATDLKVNVIWLLAQLAFNLVNAQAERSKKEATDARDSTC